MPYDRKCSDPSKLTSFNFNMSDDNSFHGLRMGEEDSKKKVNVNSRDIIQKSSEDTPLTFPDVCETPATGEAIPIPYPNIAKSSDTSKGAKTVKTDGKQVMLKDSAFEMSTGDEPATASEMELVDTGKIAEEGTLTSFVKIKKLGLPLWLWSLIGAGALLVVWLLSSNIRPTIKPVIHQ